MYIDIEIEVTITHLRMLSMNRHFIFAFETGQLNSLHRFFYLLDDK